MVKHTRRSRKTSGGFFGTLKRIAQMARPIKQSDYTQKCINIVDEQLEFMKTNGKDEMLTNVPNFSKNYISNKVNDLHYKRTIFINKCIEQLEKEPTSHFSIYIKQNGEHMPIISKYDDNSVPPSKNPMYKGGKRKQIPRRKNNRKCTNKRKN